MSKLGEGGGGLPMLSYQKTFSSKPKTLRWQSNVVVISLNLNKPPKKFNNLVTKHLKLAQLFENSWKNIFEHNVCPKV